MNLQSQTFMRMLLGGKIEISCGECEARQARLGLEWLTPPLVVASIAPVYTGVDYGKKDSLISEYESYVRGYLEREGVRVSKEDQEVLQAYRQKFGGLPADGKSPWQRCCPISVPAQLQQWGSYSPYGRRRSG